MFKTLQHSDLGIWRGYIRHVGEHAEVDHDRGPTQAVGDGKRDGASFRGPIPLPSVQQKSQGTKEVAQLKKPTDELLIFIIGKKAKYLYLIENR